MVNSSSTITCCFSVLNSRSRPAFLRLLINSCHADRSSSLLTGSFPKVRSSFLPFIALLLISSFIELKSGKRLVFFRPVITGLEGFGDVTVGLGSATCAGSAEGVTFFFSLVAAGSAFRLFFLNQHLLMTD